MTILGTSTERTSTDGHTLPGSRLRRVTEYIQTHLDQHLTLAHLGAVVYMSPYHFARLFQHSTGREPSIARIAQMVGFRTPSHFSTVFRRLMGVTPRAYRAAYVRAGLSQRGGARDGME